MFLVVPTVGFLSLLDHYLADGAPRDWAWVVIALLSLLTYGSMMSLARCRVVIDAGGVTVVNPLRRHRVAWSDVLGFGWGAWRGVNAFEAGEVPWPQAAALRWRSWYGLGMLPKTCVLLRDGTVVPSFGLTCGGAGVGGSTRKAVETLRLGVERSKKGLGPGLVLPHRVSSATGTWAPVVIATCAAAGSFSWHGQALAADWMALAMLASLSGAVRGARRRVRADERGVRAASVWGSKRIEWGQIDRFEVVRSRLGLGLRSRVVLTDGAEVKLRALSSVLGGGAEIRRKVAELEWLLADRLAAPVGGMPR